MAMCSRRNIAVRVARNMNPGFPLLPNRGPQGADLGAEGRHTGACWCRTLSEIYYRAARMLTMACVTEYVVWRMFVG